MEMTEALFRAVSEFNSGKFEDDLTVLALASNDQPRIPEGIRG